MTNTEVEKLLQQIRFAPSCVDMGWKWDVAPATEYAPGCLIRTTFQRPDRETGLVSWGYGRWWHVAAPVTLNGVVKTAFAAAKMILEHELMESFRFEGARIFDPHHTVDDLLAAVARHSTPNGGVPGG